MKGGELESRRQQPSKKAKTVAKTGTLQGSVNSEGLPTRRFAFKAASRQIAAIDIISNICISKEPPGGASCFTIYALRHLQEICCARDFTVFVKDNESKCQTLTQLIHHQNQLIESLLTRLCVAESYSVAALLGILKAIAQDLGSEFLQHLHSVMDTFAKLASSSVSSDPVILEDIFGCLAFLCKLFVTQLVDDLPVFLRNTTNLRLHKRVHVRRLAAVVIGFLLRLAPSSTFRAVYAQLVSDITTLLERAHSELEDEVTQILFSSIFSAANKLHSRALERVGILFSVLIFDQNAGSTKARCTIAEQMFNHMFERTRGEEHVYSVLTVIMELLETTLTDSSASTILSIAIASLSVRYAVSGVDLNRAIVVFNHHIRNPDHDSSQNTAHFLEFGRTFIMTLVAVKVKERHLLVAVNEIHWSLLMPVDQPEIAVELLKGMIESDIAIDDKTFRSTLIAMCLEVAYPSLVKLGDETIFLVRKLSQNLRHSSYSILADGLFTAISSNMKYDAHGILTCAHPLHAIYLLPYSTARSTCNGMMLGTIDKSLSSSNMQRRSSDEGARAFCVAIITACIESLMNNIAREYDISTVQATAQRVLQFAFVGIASPRAWTSIAEFFKTHPDQIQGHKDKLKTHMIEPCLRLIKSRDESIRTPCISMLQMIVNYSEVKIQAIQGVAELKSELDIFYTIHAFRLSDINVLMHMKHCTSALAKISLPGIFSLKSDAELKTLTHLCLGALRIRLAASWPELLAYLTTICSKSQASLLTVLKEIESIQAICLSHCAGSDASCDNINQVSTEYSVLDERRKDNCTDVWTYLDLLIRALVKCDRIQNVHVSVRGNFLKYITRVNHVDRTQRRAYDRCLHSWLVLFKELQGGSELRSADMQDALKSLVAYNNEMIAKEALSCLELWRLSYLSAEAVNYMKLLIDVKVFRPTVTSKPLTFTNTTNERPSFYISAEVRSSLSPILVGILSTHARRNDKRVRLTALMNLSIFDTEEIIPMFAESIVGITQGATRSAIISDLHKTLADDMSINQWKISTDQLRSCQKTALAFLLNLQTFSRFLSKHLEKCLIPFCVITCKLLEMHFAHGIEEEIPVLVETPAQGRDRLSKEVRRISATIILDMIERFNIHTSGYWHLISDSLLRLGSSLRSQVSSPNVPIFLQICLAISSARDMSKSKDIQNMFILAMDCVDSADMSEACCSYIFNILENVLNQYNHTVNQQVYESDEADHFLKQRPDILRKVFSRMKSRMQRYRVRGFPESITELTVYRQLVNFFPAQDVGIINLSEDITDFLVNSKRMDERNFIELVKILVNVLSRHGECDLKHIKSRLSCFFSRLRSKRARMTLISLYKLPSTVGTDLCQILEGLQATEVNKIDEPDYKLRLQTYSRLKSDWFKVTDASSVYPVVYHCIFDLRGGDFLLCKAAKETILQVATALRHLNLQKELMYENHLYKILANIVHPSLPSLLEHHIASVRIEGITVLSGLVEAIPDMYDELNDFVHHGQSDSNFFTNISHIQIRHQCEALRALTKFLQGRPFSSLSFSLFILPMLKGCLLSESQDVKELSIVAMAACLPHMTWESYITEVQKVFKKRSVQSDVWLRCLCYLVINMENVSSKISDLHDSTLETKSPGFLYLRSCILPFLETQLVCEGVSNKGVMRPVVAHAACAIICTMDDIEREHLFYKLVVRITEALNSRSQKVRDAGRNAIAKIGSFVPPKLIATIIDVVSRQLNKGFTRHVRRAVLFSLLQSCMQRLSDVEFSNILPATMQIVHDDIFGEVDEREKGIVDKNSAYKESRKSYDVQIVIQVFSRVFDCETMMFAMKPISMYMSSQLTSVTSSKLKDFLQALRRGVAMNIFLPRQTIMTVFFSTLADCIRIMNSALCSVHSRQVPQVSPLVSVCTSYAQFNPENIAVLANFALEILDDTLSRASALSLEDTESGFLVLLDCLIHCDDLQSQTLKAISNLGRLVPYLFSRHCGVLTKHTTRVLKRSCEKVTRNACFRVLVAMFRSDENLLPSAELCSLVVDLTIKQLLNSRISKANVAILSVFMGKRIAIPHLYNVVEKLINLNVTGVDVHVRASCSKLVVQFILTYPLGERKFQQLIDIMLPNLDYASAHGRLSILATISALVTKLPMEALHKQAEILLLSFLARLASDTDRACRQLCVHSALVLIKRTSSESNKSLDILQRLFAVDNEALCQSAMQVLKVCLREVPEAICTYRRIQDSLVITLDKYSRQTACKSKWSNLYNTLLLFEAALAFDISLADSIDDEHMSSILLELLQYPHFWVQLSVSRVVSLYLTSGKRENGAEGRLRARSTQYIAMLVDAHISILECAARTETPESSMKSCTAVFKNIMTASSILLYRNSNSLRQGHLRLDPYHKASTIMKNLKRLSQSKNDLLQEAALRLVAGVTGSLKDCLEQDEDILGACVDICRSDCYRSRNTQKLADEVSECISTYVSNEHWVLAVSQSKGRNFM